MKKHPASTFLGLGSTALKMFLDSGVAKIAQHRGRVITVDGKLKAWITYDPASIGHGNTEHELLILEDLTRFSLPLLKWPKKAYPDANYVGMDTEYAPDGTILDVAVSDRCCAHRLSPNVPGPLKRLWSVQDLVGHSVAGDFTNLVRLGCRRNDWAQGKNIHDSFIISRMVDENRGRGNYTVDAMLLSRHNVQGWKHKTTAYSETDARIWPADLRKERCRLDAWASYIVADDLKDKIRAEALEQATDLQTQISLSMERIRLARAYVDMPAYEAWAATVRKDHQVQKEIVTKMAWKRGMKEFSPTKPADVRTLFYTKMRLPIEYRTPKGLPAVTKSFLYRYRHEIPEVNEVCKFRSLDKTLTTYVTGIKDKILTTGTSSTIPFRLGVMGTRTGRRASDKPNAQNWPKAARAIICSRWRGGRILSNDFSKLEIILLAYEAQDEELMHYFTTEKNGYITIGTKLFGKTVDEGTSEYRQIKAVVLGVNYNLQSFGLARQLWDLHNVRLSSDYGSHTAAVDAIRTKYLHMFPKIVAYQQERVQEVRQYGSVLCWFGHFRRLPLPEEPPHSEGTDAWKQWRKHVAHLENEAINARIQNAASYVTGLAVLDVESAFLDRAGLSHVDYHQALAEGRSHELHLPMIINEVHDDIVVDCPKKEVKPAQRIIKDCMEESETLRKLMPEFTAPLRIGQKAGVHWGEANG
jgi:DNA polymerase I-like protein with 3'-5' exonuclease and polymerase domains